MEDSMTAGVSEERGRFWPILMFLVGSYCLASYFYKASFQLGDLLQGLGFLLLVPPAYFYPDSYGFRSSPHQKRRALWATWLSYFGLAFVVAGFAVKWL